jgi:imidazolonepropionase-like amidohydrolase
MNFMIYDLRFTISACARDVARISHQLYRRIAVGGRPVCGSACGFQIRDTAECNSALRSCALAATLLFSQWNVVVVRAESTLLTGATVHTVSGETISEGQVLIKDGKISAVGRSVSANGAKAVDLSGLHLYPGMIALNTDLGLVEIGAVRATRDQSEVGEFTPEVQSWLAVNPDSELLPVARANGVAYFQPTPQGGVIAGQSGLVALDGWTIEDLLVQPAIALHVYWPSAGLEVTPRGSGPGRARPLEDQDKERREKLKELDDFFEEARAYARAREASKEGDDFLRIPSWEAMLPVLRGATPITVHADDPRQIRAAVQWAETNRFKIILAEARDAWKVAGLLASNNVPVIYNHIFTQPPRDTENYDVQFAAPAVLQKAGVKVAMGLSSYRASLAKNLPYEAAQAAAFGLPADEALKSLTLYPAQIAGVADRLGSIETGKDATLVVTDGDLLDIRANVKRMWIAGREISLQNRHTRLYEKYRSRPKAP